LENMPDEILLYIFSFLDRKTLGFIPLVSRRFYDIAKDKSLASKYMLKTIRDVITSTFLDDPNQWEEPTQIPKMRDVIGDYFMDEAHLLEVINILAQERNQTRDEALNTFIHEGLEAYLAVRPLIKKAMTEKSPHLCLRGENLFFLPREFSQLKTHLEDLHLEENNLCSLESWFEEFLLLKKLFLTSNPLKYFPLAIREMKNLMVLSINHTQIELIPLWINELKFLYRLNLAHNPLKPFPEEIGAEPVLSFVPCREMLYFGLSLPGLKYLTESISHWENIPIIEVYSSFSHSSVDIKKQIIGELYRKKPGIRIIFKEDSCPSYRWFRPQSFSAH